jgi:hypothetical protein
MLLIACTNRRPDIAPASVVSEQPIPDMTAAELAQRIVRLILSTHGKQDITAARIKRETGILVKFSNTDPQQFGTSGRLAGNGSYSLISVSDGKGRAPRRLDFEFQWTSDALSNACVQPIEPYLRGLVEGGFSAKWISPPRLGSSASWHFERGDIVVTAYVGKDTRSSDAQACVSALDILAAQ